MKYTDAINELVRRQNQLSITVAEAVEICPWWGVEYGIGTSANCTYLTFTAFGWTFYAWEDDEIGWIHVQGRNGVLGLPGDLVVLRGSEDDYTLAAFAILEAFRQVKDKPNMVLPELAAAVRYAVDHCGENSGG